MTDTNASSPEVLEKLLDAHVKFELERLKGDDFMRFLEAELDELLALNDRVLLSRLVSKEQVMGVIQRTVVELEMNAGIPELAADTATAILNAPIQSQTRVKDLINKQQVVSFFEEIMELKEHRERLISGIMSHPVYQEMVSNIVYHGLINYLYEDNALSKKVPGVGSVMKLGKKMASRSGLDESFERRFKAWLSSSLPGLISRSEAFLHRALTDGELKDTVMSAWTTVEDRKISELSEGLGDIELQEFVVLGYDFWLRFRKTPYFMACCEAAVDHIYSQYGDETIGTLLGDIGVTRGVMLAELEAFGPKLMEILDEEGFLEAALRRRLSAFYHSEEAAKVVG